MSFRIILGELILVTSAVDLDPFDMDPDPAFQFDTEPDPTV
jgi:hypothetical protein